MRPPTHDRSRDVGSFSRLVSEWSRTTRALPDPSPAPEQICRAVHAEMRAETGRARRIAVLAWLLWIATVAGAGYALYKQGGQMAALQQERTSLSAELSSRRAESDRQTRLVERKQAELDALRRDASAGTHTSAALNAEIQRLSAELDRTRVQLKDAEQREAQARTRWAYAEGERDALYSHLNTLLERIENALKNAEPQAEPTFDPAFDAAPPEFPPAPPPTKD